MVQNDSERARPAERLSDFLGQPFVDWLLGNTSSQLTDEQQEVAAHVERVLDAELIGHPIAPRSIWLFPLLHYSDELKDTPINYLRMLANNDPPIEIVETGDVVLDALRHLAVAEYGELLLSVDDPAGTYRSTARGPLQRHALQALKADPSLPFTSASNEVDQLLIERSSGGGGTFQLAFLPANLIGVAFQRARVAHGDLAPQHLLDELLPTLNTARSAFRGDGAYSLGLASLSGVRLPPGGVVEFSGGRLRETQPADLPNGIVQLLGERRTQTTDESGAVVEISDVGEVVLEVSVPFRANFSPFDPMAAPSLSTLSVDNTLNRFLDFARLALLLSMGPSAPVTIPAWQRNIELFAFESYGFSQPELFSGRTPTQLTEDQVAAWQDWMDRVEAAPEKFLGPAPRRLLRAHAERHDKSDQLIDSVIVWEALFGTPQEATLRVSTSLARLLEPPGEPRKELRSRASKIYGLRSKVVHGSNYKESEIPGAALEAFEMGHRAVRTLLKERNDLLDLNSEDRSLRLLLE